MPKLCSSRKIKVLSTVSVQFCVSKFTSSRNLKQMKIYRSEMFKFLIITATLFHFTRGQCVVPLAPSHGRVQCQDEGRATICNLNCGQGYFPQGTTRTKCYARKGTWSRDFGVCLKCSTIKHSQYSRVSRIEHINGDVTFRFTCANWTELIGQEEVTCVARTGRWSHSLPAFCQPDFSNCGEKGQPRCPVINKKLSRQFAPYKALLSDKEKDLIASIIQTLRVAPLFRSSGNRCFPDMCKIKCIHLPRKYANKCKYCKRKILRCSRGGTLFG